MKKVLSVFAVLALSVAAAAFTVLALSPTAAAAQQPILTNTTVVKMSKAGLSDGLIISTIDHSYDAFKTTPSDLSDLKHDGVSNVVIVKMVKSEAFTKRWGDYSGPVWLLFIIVLYLFPLLSCGIAGNAVFSWRERDSWIPGAATAIGLLSISGIAWLFERSVSCGSNVLHLW